MKKYSRLLNNTLLFAIGNFSSKFFSLILVVIFTHYLTKDEYGQIEIYSVLINLGLPIVSLSISESVLFKTIHNGKNQKGQFCLIGWIICLFQGFLCIIIAFFFFHHYSFNSTFLFIPLILTTQSINNVFTQFTRGMDKIKLFVINSILSSILLFSISIFLVIEMRYGIKGYFLGQILTFSFSSIFLAIINYQTIECRINLKQFKFAVFDMLKFSLPLIPHTLMWWVMETSDRLLIMGLLGLSYNGLYGIANRLPVVITTLNNMFLQAWKLSSIEESESQEEELFYSQVFDIFALFQVVVCSCILVVIKLVFQFLIGEAYFGAWKLVPLQLISVLFAGFANFYSVIFYAKNKTSQSVISSLLGGILNVVLTVLLLPKLKLYGAVISTLVSFFITWICCIFLTKKYVSITIKKKKFIYYMIGLTVQISCIYINYPASIIFGLFFLIGCFFINQVIFKKCYQLSKGILYGGKK